MDYIFKMLLISVLSILCEAFLSGMTEFVISIGFIEFEFSVKITTFAFSS